MSNALYTCIFFISFVCLVLLVSLYKSRISVYYTLMFSSVLITIFGYMQIVNADSVKMALFANQTVYLGASFSPFFLMMCIADLCKIKINAKYQFVFIVYATVIFVLASSVGVTDFFYSKVELVQVNGISRLIKERGSLHILYPIFLGINIALCFAMIIYSFSNKKEVSYFTSAMLMLCMIVTVGTYAAERIFSIEVELLPIAYVVAEIIAICLLKRISLYAVTAISADSMNEDGTYGFVICDTNGRFLGGDKDACRWFYELTELKIDAIIKEEKTELLKQIGRWIRNEDNRETVYLKSGDRIIEARHFVLKEKRNNTVHCVYLRDDTIQQEYNHLLEQYKENLENAVNKKTERLNQIQNDIIISMASIVENRDNNTGGHIARTSDIIKIFVEHLKNKNEIEELNTAMNYRIGECIVKAAPLHDFGKIAIPDIILNKPGKFTDEEYAIMKNHSEKGAVIVARILKNSDDDVFRTIAINVAHYHHEKWDGTGYPEGIKEYEIPFEARVMALADVFDALVSKRVYKESMSYDEAFAIIEKSSGTHFEPRLCKAFLECRPKLEELYDSYPD